MKINELLGVKKFANMTSTEVQDYLREFSDLKPLGDGANAVALGNGKIAYKFWYKDSAYEDFLEYALKNQSNLCLPKFLSKIKTLPAFFLRDKNAPDSIKYIKMELLQRANVTDKESWLIGSVTNGLSFDEYLKKYKSDIEDPSKENKQLYNTLEEIIKLAKNAKHFEDMHGGNFLRREDGQLVIVDPIANSNDIELNDKIARFDSAVKRKSLIGKVGARSPRRT